METRTDTVTRCAHTLTESNCSSGSWAYDPDKRYIPSPRTCSTCRRLDCDDCAAADVVCQCCGGGICEGCTASARSREVRDGGKLRREFLCGPCAVSQDKSRKILEAEVWAATRCSPTFTINHSLWMDQIVADLEQAVRVAKESL